MSLSHTEIKSLALAELKTFTMQFDNEIALESLEEDIKEEFEELNSDEVKNARVSHFAIEGAVASDYAERILRLDNDRFIIYGIRHKGGNRDLPFVNLRMNFEIDTEEETLSLYKKISDELKVFTPREISFWSHKPIGTIGNCYVVAATSKILNQKKWLKEDELEFIAVETKDYYSWYEAEYEKFNEDSSELKDWVTANSEEDMEECMEDGLLHIVKYQGKRVGLIAAEESDLVGHDGFYFHELLITKEYRGQGLAKAMQRKYISELGSDSEYVWGTIFNENMASFKTARANGREKVRYECFVSLS
jgi:ribosomal protein S18 acetylase RimI-like enzyme